VKDLPKRKPNPYFFKFNAKLLFCEKDLPQNLVLLMLILKKIANVNINRRGEHSINRHSHLASKYLFAVLIKKRLVHLMESSPGLSDPRARLRGDVRHRRQVGQHGRRVRQLRH
jgi:hypothetical protein